MNKIELEPTESSPGVIFNPETLVFELRGYSRPDNANKFYEPLIKWWDEYSLFLGANKANLPSKLIFQMHIEYFNSTSSKYLLNLLDKLNDIKRVHAIPVEIVWQYDEDDFDMRETGEEYERVLKLPFVYEGLPTD